MLKYFLFWEIDSFMFLADDLNKITIKCIFLIFCISLLIIKTSLQYDHESLIRRLFFAYFVCTFIGYYPKIAFFGFDIGDSIIKKNNISFIKNWKNIKKASERQLNREKKESSFLSELTYIFNFDTDDLIDKFMAMAIICMFFILKLLYSATYYLSYCLLPVIAAISMIPQMRGISDSIIKTLLWPILVPIVVSLLMASIGKTLEFSANESGFVNNIVAYCHLFIFLLLILGSFSIVKMILSGNGVEHWASAKANQASFIMMMGASNLAKSSITKAIKDPSKLAMNAGKNLLAPAINSTRSIGGNFKQAVNTKADNIRDNKAIFDSKNLKLEKEDHFQIRPIKIF